MELTRRNLLKGGALLAAGAAGMSLGLTGCAGNGSESQNVEYDWQGEADIIALGFGMAGMGATIAAYEAGLTVMILEAAPEELAGGASTAHLGLMQPKNSHFLEFLTYGKWDEERRTKTAERALTCVDWVCDTIPDRIQQLPYENTTLPGTPGRGVEMYNALVPQVKALEGVTVHYESRAIRLIQNEAGEVIGVVVDHNGEELAYKAKVAVVICTGSYASNKEMVRSFNFPELDYNSGNSPYAQGDGIVMAAALGAKLYGFSQNYEWFAKAMKKPSEDFGSSIQLASDGVGGCIYVNRQGKRFENENESMTHNKTLSCPMTEFYGLTVTQNMSDEEVMTRGYINQPMWAIWDSEMINDTIICNTMPWTWAMTHGFEWGEDNLAHVAKGWLLEADTLEELAGKLEGVDMWGNPVSVDPKALAETVSQYNGYVEQGFDPDFNRPADKMRALATPPYYATQLTPSLLYTINGLVTNTHSQVLDWNEEPIPRLYSAGDVSQGLFLNVLGITGCYAQGYIGAEHAAANLQPWDAE